MSDYADWVVSITTIITLELMIWKRWYAWVIGLLNQVVWTWFIVETEQYGLLALNIALYIQNIRGLINWFYEEKAEDGKKDSVSDGVTSSAGKTAETGE